MTEPLFPARIIAITLEAEDILSFVLRPMNPALPEQINPGSHVDVHLPNGMMRSYSLSNGPEEKRGYRLTVARDANSRGGSVYMHDELRVGQIIEVSKPRNNFRLAEQASMSVFISGGIGVTPFVPMVARLNELGRPWRMHYCVRSRDRAAFVEEIEQLAANGSGEFISNYDDESGLLDLPRTLASVPAGADVYCCGPTGMLDAFRAGAQDAGVASDRVHFEYFSSNIERAAAGGFLVVLNKSGAEVPVKPGQTILQALIEHGMNVPYSCEEGICGSCETRVIDGLPDHRDMILNEEERQKSQTMMICCSGSRSPRLVLDL
jgi:vanillate O-demethylase ferredoxin subunit